MKRSEAVTKLVTILTDHPIGAKHISIEDVDDFLTQLEQQIGLCPPPIAHEGVDTWDEESIYYEYKWGMNEKPNGGAK